MKRTTPAQLLAAARAASRNAYAPYSRFAVGAAVLTAGGHVFAAANVENASYGLTLCAERAAVCKAVSEGETRVVAAAVYAPGAKTALPCGACLQVLVEFGPDAWLVLGGSGAPRRRRLAQLLPQAFRLERK